MIVIDTNVVSEVLRPEPEEAVVSWLNDQSIESLHLASVTLAELLFGVGAMSDGRRRNVLYAAMDLLLGLFSGRILAFDQDAARRYAEMAVAARAAGHPLATADGHIAATAAAHGFGVATRDIGDFEATGVELIDPWTAR